MCLCVCMFARSILDKCLILIQNLQFDKKMERDRNQVI